MYSAAKLRLLWAKRFRIQRQRTLLDRLLNKINTNFASVRNFIFTKKSHKDTRRHGKRLGPEERRQLGQLNQLSVHPRRAQTITLGNVIHIVSSCSFWCVPEILRRKGPEDEKKAILYLDTELSFAHLVIFYGNGCFWIVWEIVKRSTWLGFILFDSGEQKN